MNPDWENNPGCYYFYDSHAPVFQRSLNKDLVKRIIAEISSYSNAEDFILYPGLRREKPISLPVSIEPILLSKRTIRIKDLYPKTNKRDWQTHRNERKR